MQEGFLWSSLPILFSFFFVVTLVLLCSSRQTFVAEHLRRSVGVGCVHSKMEADYRKKEFTKDRGRQTAFFGPPYSFFFHSFLW